MGWTFFPDTASKTAKQIIVEEFSQYGADDWAHGVEYATQNGSTVYLVMWRENLAQKVARSYYGLIVLTCRKKGQFGYKEMGEEMGPYHYGATLKMVDLLDRLAPNENGYALKWRETVRQKLAAKKAKRAIKWQPGLKVQFSATGPVYEIVSSAGPRRGFHVRIPGHGNSLYRASAGHMARAVLV
jgi:hypothetical protein